MASVKQLNFSILWQASSSVIFVHRFSPLSFLAVWSRRRRSESTLPLMVDTEAGQPGNGLSLHQILQTDGALANIFTEHVRCTYAHATPHTEISD